MSTCLVGDFNLPHIEWRSLSSPGSENVTKESMFLEMCGRLGFSQLVSSPTRPKSRNILDLVLSNDDTVESVEVRNSPIPSDHNPVLFSIRIPRKTEDKDENLGEGFDHTRGDYGTIRLNLQLTNWYTFFSHCDGIEEMYKRLSEYLKYLRDLLIPPRGKRKQPINKLVETLTKIIHEEENPTELARLRLQLARANKRLRVLNEYRVIAVKNAKTFYKYLVKPNLLGLFDHSRIDSRCITSTFRLASVRGGSDSQKERMILG